MGETITLPTHGQTALTITYTQKREDFADAARAVSSKRLGTYMLIFWAVLVLMQVPRLYEAMKISGSLTQALHENAVGVMTVLAVAVLYLLLILIQPIVASRRAVPREVTWTLDETGVAVNNDVLASQMQWKAFVYFRETPKVFLLYVQKGRAHFIPKRVLNANQLYELRDTLLTHMPQR